MKQVYTEGEVRGDEMRWEKYVVYIVAKYKSGGVRTYFFGDKPIWAQCKARKTSCTSSSVCSRWLVGRDCIQTTHNWNSCEERCQKYHSTIKQLICRVFLYYFSPEDGDSILLRNVGMYQQVHTALQHRRPTATLHFVCCYYHFYYY
jgi:hypothetical protein